MSPPFSSPRLGANGTRRASLRTWPPCSSGRASHVPERAVNRAQPRLHPVTPLARCPDQDDSQASGPVGEPHLQARCPTPTAPFKLALAAQHRRRPSTTSSRPDPPTRCCSTMNRRGRGEARRAQAAAATKPRTSSPTVAPTGHRPPGACAPDITTTNATGIRARVHPTNTVAATSHRRMALDWAITTVCPGPVDGRGVASTVALGVSPGQGRSLTPHPPHRPSSRCSSVLSWSSTHPKPTSDAESRPTPGT